MRLQILGIVLVQKYDSWITNKHLYPIDLGARRKGTEWPELLVLYILTGCGAVLVQSTSEYSSSSLPSYCTDEISQCPELK